MCESLVRPWLAEFETLSFGQEEQGVLLQLFLKIYIFTASWKNCDLCSELSDIQNVWKDKHRTSAPRLPRLQQFVVHHLFKSDVLD